MLSPGSSIISFTNLAEHRIRKSRPQMVDLAEDQTETDSNPQTPTGALETPENIDAIESTDSPLKTSPKPHVFPRKNRLYHSVSTTENPNKLDCATSHVPEHSETLHRKPKPKPRQLMKSSSEEALSTYAIVDPTGTDVPQ